jgi:hypothetical protein
MDMWLLKPGNGRELLERIDDVLLLDAAHHRDHDAAGHGERGQDEGGLVAHAAGGILVDLRLRDVRQVDHLAGKHHLLREDRRLLGRHVGEVNRHQEGRLLVLGHLSIKGRINDVADFFLRKFLAVAFLLNQ